MKAEPQDEVLFLQINQENIDVKKNTYYFFLEHFLKKSFVKLGGSRWGHLEKGVPVMQSLRATALVHCRTFSLPLLEKRTPLVDLARESCPKL